MSYMIAKQQNIITLKAIEYFENNFNAQQQLRLDMDALQKDKVDRDTYYNNQNIYTLVTNAYAKAQSRAKEDVNKLLTSITVHTGNIYIYKLLIDKGSDTSLSDNVDSIREEYSTFNKEVIHTLRALNKKYKRSTKELNIQVSTTATEHAFRNNFKSILLHSHSLLLSSKKLNKDTLESIIANKLPSKYNVQVKEFNSYKSDEQLVINRSNKDKEEVTRALTNYITYIYKTVSQKPFKSTYELNNFEKLPIKQRYNLIKLQQLITKGIRKHKTLTIKFTQAKELKISTKYLKYIPLCKCVKTSTFNIVCNNNLPNNIQYLTPSRRPYKEATGVLSYMYIIIQYYLYQPLQGNSDPPFLDTG